jgi:anti-sigma factor RsiW
MMKKLSQQHDELLQGYLDGTLDARGHELLAKAMEENTALHERLETLKMADLLLTESRPEQPSQNFTGTVMNKLQEYPQRRGLSISNGILLLAGILSVVAVAAVLLSAGMFDQTSTFDLNNLTVAQRYIRQNLPGIPLNGKFIVYTIILLNLALVLVVLGKTILKPFFQRRLETGH